MSAKSSQQIGQESVEALKKYLDALKADGQGLPGRNGKVSVSAVALAMGTDRQTLYKNSGCRTLLESAAQELGLQSIEARASGPSTKDDAKTQRIQVLEAQVATLKAEVEGLRRQLSRYAHIEQHMVETGMRVIT